MLTVKERGHFVATTTLRVRLTHGNAGRLGADDSRDGGQAALRRAHLGRRAACRQPRQAHVRAALAVAAQHARRRCVRGVPRRGGGDRTDAPAPGGHVRRAACRRSPTASGATSSTQTELVDAPTVRILERYLGRRRAHDRGVVSALRQELPALQLADQQWVATLEGREAALEPLAALPPEAVAVGT